MPIPESNCVDIDTPVFQSSDMGRFGQVINLYVEAPQHTQTETAAFSALVKQLPPPMQHGIRTRVWSHWYGDAPYPGLTVGMQDVTVITSTEILIPYEDFNMDNVPWDKLAGEIDVY